jgi:hypothetical protein
MFFVCSIFDIVDPTLTRPVASAAGIDLSTAGLAELRIPAFASMQLTRNGPVRPSIIRRRPPVHACKSPASRGPVRYRNPAFGTVVTPARIQI